VDPISHVIFGQTLVTAVGRHPAMVRGRTLAAILGALAPDIDALLMPFGWDLYLRAHEVGTHTIAGSVVLACLVALLVQLFQAGGVARVWRARRSRFIDLLWPAWLGCLSHVALDIVSGAQVRVAWPIGGGRISLPLVAMAEPWLIAIFAAGAAAMALARHRRRRAAGAVLVIAAAFLGVKSIQLTRALPTLAAAADAPVVARVIEARWASLADWYVFERQPERLRQWHIRAGAAPTLLLSWPVVAESPLVAQSRGLDTVSNFLAVHELGFAAELRQGDGGTRVLWSDIRYCWRPDAAAAADANLEPVVTTDTSAEPSRLVCGLWFGGTFDENGHPLKQLVKVGGWWQARAPAP
jgi:membrane-bound metal-dependent hydrolase YbcI (DUF457 family)